jgi:hypothetical protein
MNDDYDADFEEAKAEILSYADQARFELEQAIADAEAEAEIEADDDADTNEFGFRPYLDEHGRKVAFESFCDEDMDAITACDARAGRNGWRFWTRDSTGNNWYTKSDSPPPMIRTVSSPLYSAAALDDEPTDDEEQQAQAETADDLSAILNRLAELENRVEQLEQLATKPDDGND